MTFDSLKRAPNKHYFIFVLLVGVLSFSSFSLVIYRHYTDMQELNEYALNDGSIARRTRHLLFNVLSMETGVRGYLLTGRKSFLEPYEAGQQAIPQEIEGLKPILARTTDSQDSMLDWLKQIQGLQDTFHDQLVAYDRGGRNAFSANVLELQKIQMDHLRDTLEDFIKKQSDALKARKELIHNEQENFILILTFGTILAIIALAAAVLSILVLIGRNEKAKEQVAQSEERFRTIMHGINDGVFDYFPAEQRLYLSPGLKSMLGYADSDIPNTVAAYNCFVHPDDVKDFWEFLHSYETHEVKEYKNTFRMLHKNGDWRWILTRGIGFWDEDDVLKRLTGTHMDITEEKQREDELMQVNAELETFTYVASHDLRSPLVNLKGFANELHGEIDTVKGIVDAVKSDLTDQQREILKTSLEQDIPEALGFIEKATDRMDRLTSAVLDLSRIGKREFHFDDVDVEGLVKKCLAAQAYEINSGNIHVACGALPVIYTDALALEQVFANLIDNAVKYLDKSRPGQIVIDAEEHMTAVIYSVRDNGRGIDPADQKKIFEMFRRARNTGDVRGTGMGMSYVRATLHKLGGTIWCESESGVGSVFHVRIPKKFAKGLVA